MRILLNILVVLWLAGCSPVNHQQWFVTTAPDGSLVHNFTGYTSLGETTKGDSKRYLEEAIDGACKMDHPEGGYKILRLDEWPSNNAAGDFLYWAGAGSCAADKGKKP